MGAVPVSLDSFRLLYVRLLEFTSVDYWILFRYGSCRRDSFRLLYTLLTTNDWRLTAEGPPQEQEWSLVHNKQCSTSSNESAKPSDRRRQTDRHTHSQTKYRNPCCACTPRVNNQTFSQNTFCNYAVHYICTHWKATQPLSCPVHSYNKAYRSDPLSVVFQERGERKVGRLNRAGFAQSTFLTQC